MYEEDNDLESVEQKENTDSQDQAVDYKALYDEAQAKADKYQWYFKKEKAKQKNANVSKNTDSTIDADALRKSIVEEVGFYSSTPTAQQYKEKIDEYVARGLSYEDSYQLVASKENPSLLIDQQTKNKTEVTDITWVPTPWTVSNDYSSMEWSNVKNLSDKEFDEYWNYKKGVK